MLLTGQPGRMSQNSVYTLPCGAQSLYLKTENSRFYSNFLKRVNQANPCYSHSNGTFAVSSLAPSVFPQLPAHNRRRNKISDCLRTGTTSATFFTQVDLFCSRIVFDSPCWTIFQCYFSTDITIEDSLGLNIPGGSLTDTEMKKRRYVTRILARSVRVCLDHLLEINYFKDQGIPHSFYDRLRPMLTSSPQTHGHMLRALYGLGEHFKSTSQAPVLSSLDLGMRIQVLGIAIVASFRNQTAAGKKINGLIITTDAAHSAYTMVTKFHESGTAGKKSKQTTVMPATIGHANSGQESVFFLNLFSQLQTNRKFADEICSAVTTAKQTGNNRSFPIVSYTPINNPSPNGPPLGAIVIRSAFSSQFIEKTENFLDSALFAKGIGGRDRSYIRSCSRLQPPCPFLIGRNLYDSVPASEHETVIMNLMESILLQSGSVSFTKINQLQIVVAPGMASGYKSHSDSSHFLNRLDAHPLPVFESFDDGTHLPTCAQQQTITFIITSCPSNISHTISWHAIASDDPDQSLKPQSLLLGSADLDGNCIHIQLPGLQSGIEHVIKNAKPNQKLAHRCVISGRCTGCTCGMSDADLLNRANATQSSFVQRRITASEYSYRKVLTCMLTGQLPPRAKRGYDSQTQTTTQDDKTSPPLAKKQRLLGMDHPDALQSDTFVQLPMPEYLKCGIIRSATKVGFGQPAYRTMLSAPVVKAMALDHACITMAEIGTCAEESLRDMDEPTASATPITTSRRIAAGVRRKNPVKKPQAPTTIHSMFCFTRESKESCGNGPSGWSPPTSIELPVPMQRYNLVSIANQAGLTYHTRAKPPLHNDPDQANVAIISEKYKNCFGSVQGYYQWHGIDPDEDREGYESRPPSIVIYGSGGAPAFSSNYQPDASTIDKGSPNMKMPTPQRMTSKGTNNCLQELCARRAVVALFAHERTFGLFPPPTTSQLNGNSPKNNDGDNEEQSATDDNDNAGVFLGYFTPATVTLQSTDFDAIKSECQKNKFSVDEMDYSRFREEVHLACRLDPLFDRSELAIIQANSETSKWRIGRLASKCYEQIVVQSPGGNIDNLTRMSPDSAISLEECLRRLTKSKTICTLFDNDMSDTFEADDSELSSNNELLITSHIGAGTKLAKGASDVVAIACLVSWATACRYMRVHILDDEFASPLSLKQARGMGSALRGSPLASPIRAYDPMPLLLRGCAIALGLLISIAGIQVLTTVGRIERTINDESWLVPKFMFADMLFRAILIRFTGRVSRYSSYHRHLVMKTRKSSDGMEPHVPGIAGWPTFRTYIQETSAGMDTMSKWVSGQHKSSLPSIIVGSMTLFIDFMDIVASRMDALTNSVLLSSRGGEEGGEGGVASAINALAKLLRDFLNEAVGGNNAVWTGSRFISSEIIHDMCEIYCDPFGPPESNPNEIVMGAGSTQAMKLMPGAGGHDDTKECLSDVLVALKSFCSSGSTMHAESMGLTPLAVGSCAVAVGSCAVALNGRELNLKDAEHVMCKVYTLVYKTICDRSVSLRPLASKPELHPIKLVSVCPWDDDLVKSIMQRSMAATSALVISGSIVLPESCLLMGEKREVPLAGAVEVDDSETLVALTTETGLWI